MNFSKFLSGRFLAGLALLAGLAGCGPEAPLPHLGIWEVTQVIAAEEGEEAAGGLNALVGQRAVYTRHIAHFESMQCLRPQYTLEPMPADGAAPAVARVDQGALRERIAISCQGETLPPEQGGMLYLRDRDTLLMTWRGGVLYLQRRSQGPSASY
ncbi:hypothetical protein [Ectothiorhodospira mobilis]|uniref:hypothetical protein n=1 Tax=Ectothiorhodospira mobilis TaxID=195064 RepID=UPI001903A81D|nr:hypothetical protein [Ectothiorhodospira mobilis]MBK1690815.1 hypothetical protein [Ectothiorhodospira mobilis]